MNQNLEITKEIIKNLNNISEKITSNQDFKTYIETLVDEQQLRFFHSVLVTINNIVMGVIMVFVIIYFIKEAIKLGKKRCIEKELSKLKAQEFKSRSTISELNFELKNTTSRLQRLETQCKILNNKITNRQKVLDNMPIANFKNED